MEGMLFIGEHHLLSLKLDKQLTQLDLIVPQAIIQCLQLRNHVLQLRLIRTFKKAV